MRLSAGLVAVQAEALDAQSHRSCTCSWNNKNVGVLTLERHDLRESWVLLGVGHQRPFGYDAAWYGKLLYCSSRKFFVSRTTTLCRWIRLDIDRIFIGLATCSWWGYTRNLFIPSGLGVLFWDGV